MSGRVYRIWVPDLSATTAGLHFLAFGILGSWIVAYTAAMIVFLPFFGGMDDPPSWIYHVSIVVGVFGSVRFARYWARRGYARAMRGREVRERRLARFATDATTAERFPHRSLEYALTRPNRREQRLKEWLHRAAPGTIVVVGGPRLRHGVRPEYMELPFEPIRLDDDSPNARELVLHSIPQGELEGAKIPEWVDADEAYDDVSAGAPPRWTAEFALTVAGFGLTATAVAKREYGLAGVGLPVAAGGWALFLCRHRFDAWLVPGGIATRHRSWRWGASSFRVLSATDTPLIVDCSSNLTILRDARRIHRIPIAPAIGLLLAAVWRSGAQPPTARMVRSLLESR